MKTVVYLYESAFMMWRRRLEGIYAVARKENWHIEAVDVGELAGSAFPALRLHEGDGPVPAGLSEEASDRAERIGRESQMAR